MHLKLGLQGRSIQLLHKPVLTRLLFICMIIDKGDLVIMTCHLRINILLQRKTKRTYVKQQQQLCYYGFY